MDGSEPPCQFTLDSHVRKNSERGVRSRETHIGLVEKVKFESNFRCLLAGQMSGQEQECLV